MRQISLSVRRGVCLFKVCGLMYLPCFQVRRMVSGRVACPMSVERSCSRPSTTCWSAVSWTAALSASASGLWSHTKRRRRPLIKGMSCFLIADNKVLWCIINCQIKAHPQLMVRSQVVAGVCSVWWAGIICTTTCVMSYILFLFIRNSVFTHWFYFSHLSCC